MSDPQAPSPEILPIEDPPRALLVDEMTLLLDAQQVDQATREWASRDTDAALLKSGLVLRSRELVRLVRDRAASDVEAVASASGMSEECAAAKLFWGLVLTSVRIHEPTPRNEDGSFRSQPMLAAFLLLGLNDEAAWPAWSDATMTGAQERSRALFGKDYEELPGILPPDGVQALKTWNPSSAAIRQTLADFAYEPSSNRTPKSSLTKGGHGRRRIAEALVDAVLSLMADQTVTTRLAQQLSAESKTVSSSWVNARKGRITALLVLTIVLGALITWALRNQGVDVSDHRQQAVILPIEESSYQATVIGARNVTLKQKIYRKSTSASLGDDIEFRLTFESVRSTGPEKTTYLRLRETLVDEANSPDYPFKSYAFYAVGLNGVEELIAGSQFQLDMSSDDTCLSGRVTEISEVTRTHGLVIEPTPAEDQPEMAYLHGSSALFTTYLGVIKPGTPIRIDGRLTLAMDKTPDPDQLDGTSLLISAAGSPNKRDISPAQPGDVIDIVVPLHRGACTTREYTPVVRIAAKPVRGAGYIRIVSQDGGGREIGRAILNVIGETNPGLREIPGTTKFWRSTCNGSKVIDRLDPGILSGGVTTGPVPAFVARDKCHGHMRWVTVKSLVTSG